MDRLTLLTHPLTQRCAIGIIPVALEKAGELELASPKLLRALGDAEIHWRQTTSQLTIGDKLYYAPSPKPVVEWFIEVLEQYITLQQAITKKAISSDFLLMSAQGFYYSDDFQEVTEALSQDMQGKGNILPIINSSAGVEAKFVSRDLAGLVEIANNAKLELCAIAQLPPSDLFGVDFSSTFASDSQKNLSTNSVAETIFKWRLWLDAD
jgi:hypothetical protein